jgi:hypothetical protein
VIFRDTARLPCSSHLGLSLALDHVVRLRPRRLLDIGVGFGKWGFLLREALDYVEGRVEREQWTVRIDGIDAHRYESPLLDWVYDDVRIADALDVTDELAGYDVVVIGDVIEHFEKEQGVSLLDALLRQNRNVVLTTPLEFFEQHREDNPYEEHRSHWRIDDFARWAFDYDVAGGFQIVVALAGRGATEPQLADARASRIAYGTPLLARRGAAARVVKQLLRSVLRGH